MLGYVHLTAGRPVLERRAAAGMTYWALEGDLDGGLFPGRRLRRWIGGWSAAGCPTPPCRRAGRGILPLCVRFCRTDCGWPCCRNCWTPWPPPGTRPCCWRTTPTAGLCWRPRSWPALPAPAAGDGSGTGGPGAAAAAAAGTYHRRRPRRRHRDLRPAAPGGPAPVSDSRLRPAPGGTVRLAGPVPDPAAGGASVPAAPACRLPEICVKSVETLDIGP